MIVLVLMLFLLGSAAMSVGAGMICLPAGIIVGGAALIILALLLIYAVGSRES
ncbi:MAG: hypothetical protein K6C12_03225 [Oscillospiraceae bacterium]|nr:hypothetical protein [Oscillospiraceae bacterium]